MLATSESQVVAASVFRGWRASPGDTLDTPQRWAVSAADDSVVQRSLSGQALTRLAASSHRGATRPAATARTPAITGTGPACSRPASGGNASSAIAKAV